MSETAQPNEWTLWDLRQQLQAEPTEERLLREIKAHGWTVEWSPPIFGQPVKLRISRKRDTYVTDGWIATGWSTWAAVADAAWAVIFGSFDKKMESA